MSYLDMSDHVSRMSQERLIGQSFLQHYQKKVAELLRTKWMSYTIDLMR